VKRLLSKHSIAPRTAAQSQSCKRILLGQLASHGDCLYATVIARQIKTDYPGCHLTWAIGSMYSSILNGNPHVDEVWEIPLANHKEVCNVWQKFEREALERKKLGDFDKVFLTQLYPNNIQNFDGTVRSSIFRGYPRPITVPVAPVIQLLPNEIENVRCFAEAHHLGNKAHVILFECSPKSGQSFITIDFALEFAQNLTRKISDVCIILSSNIPIQSTDERIIDGSILSFRENAELTKYCSLLIGGSSGISWLCTSDWAKPLPMIQLLKKEQSVYASFVNDYEYWGIATDNIIEMTDCQVDRLVKCVVAYITEGFPSTRLVFHEHISVTFDFYYKFFLFGILVQGEYKKALISMLNTIRRYGLHPRLLEFVFVTFIKHSRKLLSKFMVEFNT